MKKIIGLCILFWSTVLIAQKYNLNHKEYVNKLKNAKEIQHKQYLDIYDRAIQLRPNDIDLKIEKCNYINFSYYDEYEEYSLNYEAFVECINKLYKEHQNNPKVLLFKARNTYGDSLADVLKTAKLSIRKNAKSWNPNQASELYYTLAKNSFNKENFSMALNFLEKARVYKDTTDYSILSAKIYMSVEDKKEALSALLEKLEKDAEAWKLNQKAELLLKLEKPNKALELYKRVEKKDSSYVNNANLTKVFKDLEKYDIARSYLVKDTIHEWKKAQVLSDLFVFDLEYSKPQEALNSYRKAQDVNFYDDFFGVKRIKVFLRSPFLGWSLNEVLHIIILLLTIVVLFVAPYIIVLPIQFLGKRLNWKPVALKVPFDWNLKHFWLIIFAYFSIDFILQLIFEYQLFLDAYFSDYTAETGEVNGQLYIAYFSLMALGVGLFLNKKRLSYLTRTNLPVLRTITLFVVFMIVNMTLIKILRSVDLSIIPMSLKAEIKFLITEYGFSVAFFFVVLLVPIYEEVIFRGIILSSVEKHVGFWKANLIQAVLFALVHQNMEVFLFYILFAVILGLLAKKTKGLLTGILFHAGNNFMFLIALYFSIMTEGLK